MEPAPTSDPAPTSAQAAPAAPQEKPRPRSILIDGHSDYGVPSGEYSSFGGCYKNHYVLTSAVKAGIRMNGYADEGLTRRPHLTFLHRDDHGDTPGYYLCAVKDSEDRYGYAKEMPDSSWRVWDERVDAWVEIATHLLHATYRY